MIYFYNTLTTQKTAFQPNDPQNVGMYVCGVTVYDYCHLGHARIYTAVDMIIRYLQFRGYKINYVRNITDIDDKIIKRAHEHNLSVTAITQQFTQAMHEDFAALNLLVPKHEPRATDYIPQMIQLIESMLVKEHAYVASNGDVYFAVRSFAAYGRLSHHALDELESGARVSVGEAKQDPLDFVLWKAAKPGEPAWDSPWGKGRPGWHIECSAMSMALLGEEFAIHAGGRDLIFPHHENEIAQSCAASGKQFASVWLHGGFLQVDEEKMSKSLGNFVTIRDVLAVESAEVLRYLLLASHYRSPLIYTTAALAKARAALTRLYHALRFFPAVERIKDTLYEEKFIAAMDDDINSPLAIAVLFDLAHETQRLRALNDATAAHYAALLKYLANILGLLERDPEEFFTAGLLADEVREIKALIEARNQARAAQDFKQADQIRQQLLAMNIIIEDGGKTTTWRRKSLL